MKELILTGLKRVDRISYLQPCYLGPWCISYQEMAEKNWKVDFVLSEKFYSFEEINKKNKYVNELIERLIPSLTFYLNQRYQLNMKCYWEVLLSYWLQQWLTIYHDRFCALKEVESSIVKYYAQVLKSPEILRTENSLDINFLTTSHWDAHYYNLQIFSLILEKSPIGNVSVVKIDVDSPSVGKNDLPFFSMCAGKVKKFAKHVFQFFLTSSSRFLVGEIKGLSKFDLIKLKLSLPLKFPFCRMVRAKKLRDVEKDLKFEFRASNPFESFVAEIIIESIPSLLVDSIHLCSNREVFFIGNDFYDPSSLKNISAVLEAAGKWFNFQHGSGYGMRNVNPVSMFEYRSIFVTWGWDHPDGKHSVKIAGPSPYLSKRSGRASDKSDNGGKILWISSPQLPYCYRYHSELTPFGYIEYLKNIHIVLDQSPSNVFLSVPKSSREMINIEKYQNKLVPKALSEVQDDFDVFVVDYFGTPLLELSSQGREVIWALDPAIFQWNSYTSAVFEPLLEKGYYPSVEKLLQKIRTGSVIVLDNDKVNKNFAKTDTKIVEVLKEAVLNVVVYKDQG